LGFYIFHSVQVSYIIAHLSDKCYSIEDRIVSLTQPHIRPIVRGKAGKPVEFGAKLSASCRNGYVFLDRISWDNFNESVDLKKQVEEFKRFTGFSPESIHVARIYCSAIKSSGRAKKEGLE
jgi:IS5 family transposase